MHFTRAAVTEFERFRARDGAGALAIAVERLPNLSVARGVPGARGPYFGRTEFPWIAAAFDQTRKASRAEPTEILICVSKGTKLSEALDQIGSRTASPPWGSTSATSRAASNG